ncbi:MAG: hypothetical protein U0324_25480 [Polyangiales bacterium]
MITRGFLLAALAAAMTGCPDDPPTPDASRDVPGDRDVVNEASTDVEDGDVADAPDDVQPDAPSSCGDTRFVRPTADAVLGIADDSDRDCSNGFTANVQVSTNAPAGTMLVLEIGGREAGTATVAGSIVTFPNVMFDTGGMQTLQVRADGVMAPCATATVTVSCNLPRCQITAPARSTLNEADNASPGMRFTTAFTVGTDIEDGREVELFVSNSTFPLRAAVMGGMAQFRNVALAPDGAYRVRAVCTNRAGNSGMSAESTFTVDSTAPTLTVARPAMGATIGVSADSNPMTSGVQFQVCGRSSEMGQELCAAQDGAMPTCATVASTSADTCVELTCPTGNAPFAVEVTARDEAGNVARRTITDIRCQSTLPSVRIVAPAAYDAMDRATILNRTRDADPATAGLQADVVACTDRASGMASLFFNGETTTPAVPPVAVAPTAMGDPCAALGMGFVGIARFPRVTVLDTSPAPSRPTDTVAANPTLQVAVTDGGDTGRSPSVQLFVDSVAPTVSIVTCGLTVTPGTDGTGTSDIDVTSDVYPVTLTLTRAGGMPTTLTLMAPSLPAGRGRFMAVRFQAGTTTLTASATDPAGNATTTTAPCTVEVGNPPTLSFSTPTPGQVFSASATTNVTLRSDAPVGTAVSLTVGTSPAVMGTVAAGGTVTFSNVMLPQGDAVVLTAATATVPGRGVGRATVTVTVDTQAPTAPTMLAVAVPTTPASARRAGTVRLSWVDGADPAPGGGTRAVTRYELRYGTLPITDANFAMAIPITASATPGMPGAANQVDVTGLRLGRPYYFAMRSIDRGGLPSSVVGTTASLSIDLLRDTVTDVPVALGGDLSGGGDVNGDSFADLVVASGSTSGVWAGVARIYFGSATGISATRYTEFRGNTGNRFGASVASLGDVNGDGLGDVAIAEPGPLAAASLGPGAVYVFFGRRTWNPATTPYVAANANVTIGGGTGEFATASLGFALTRVGDFNGDGLNDIAASAPQSTSRGAVLVFFGRTTFPSTLAPAAADVTIRNSSMDTLFGRTLAGIGRVVGNDTREDLAIGYGATTVPAAAAVFAGRAAATPVGLTLVDAALNRPGTVTAANNLGQFAVGGPGDLDGDGRGDFAVGTAARGPGSVALYFGNTSGGLTAGPTIDSTLPATATADAFGTRIASIVAPGSLRPSLLVPSPIGADLLVGSNGVNGTDPRLYVFTGRASWTGLNPLLADLQVPFTGAATQPFSGAAWVGDVDGDGAPDAAIARSTGAGTVIILR